MLPTTPAATFYFLVAVANTLCYLLMSAADHFKDFHQRGARYSIATCPTFVPQRLFLLLHKKRIYPVLCHSVSPLFFLASQYPISPMHGSTTHLLVLSGRNQCHQFPSRLPDPVHQLGIVFDQQRCPCLWVCFGVLYCIDRW